MLHSNQHSKSILERKEAIYICDKTGTITLFNKAAATLWGREPIINQEKYCGAVKLLNKNGDVLAKNDYPLLISLRENRIVDVAELVIERPDGSLRQIQQSAVPIYDSQGQLAGAINLLIDITSNDFLPTSIAILETS